MTKNYKDLKRFIGDSDMAALTVVTQEKPEFLKFGMDGEYCAYIVKDWSAEKIPSHYELEITCENWVRIYDDEGLTYIADAERIEIYRAGDFGCLINLVNEK